MRSWTIFCTTLSLTSIAAADIDVGSDGSDGALVATNTPIDLSLAASFCDCDGDNQVDDPCRWDCPSPEPGQGVYDAEQWAVVFKYDGVAVPAGVTVRFLNHESRAPVVWLSQTDVLITGTIDLNGGPGHHYNESRTPSLPGPGGFAGGRGGDTGSDASSGFGPGGSVGGFPDSDGSGGGYATLGATGVCFSGPGGPTYGNSTVLPLIGGSGGSGGQNSHTPAAGAGGGAGGGAILIAANGTITLTGLVRANGGLGGNRSSTDLNYCTQYEYYSYAAGGGGSGGAIRLIADRVEGAGRLRAEGGGGGRLGGGSTHGGMGGFGRIRVEGNAISITDPGNPLFIPEQPTFVFPPSHYPSLRARTLGSQLIPVDPSALYTDAVNDPDVRIATTEPVSMQIEAKNVPEGTTVQIRIKPVSGAPSVFTSSPLVDSEGVLKATADVEFPRGFSIVQLRATFAPSPLDGHGMLVPRRLRELRTVSGERIVMTNVEAVPGGSSQIVYVTETGRQIHVGSR